MSATPVAGSRWGRSRRSTEFRARKAEHGRRQTDSQAGKQAGINVAGRETATGIVLSYLLGLCGSCERGHGTPQRCGWQAGGGQSPSPLAPVRPHPSASMPRTDAFILSGIAIMALPGMDTSTAMPWN